MKHLNKKLSEFAKQISEHADGSLEGGFKIITIENNALILGGEDTNNCNAGNCVAGCGQNDVPGCGTPTNAVKGCGG